MSNTTTEQRSEQSSHSNRGTGVGESFDGQPSVEQSDRLLARMPDPTYLALLFFLGIPGTLVPSLEWLETFYLFGLFGLWPMLEGFLPTSSNEADQTGWIRMGTRSKLRPLISMVYIQLNPFLQLKGVFQLAGHLPVLLRYRFRLPDPETFEQSVDYRLPIENEWTIVNGGPTREHSHSWGMLAQRYAYDLVVTDDQGQTYADDGDRPEAYHCYSEPVVAPADGVIVGTSDGHRDYHRAGGWLDPRQRDPRGNYLTIKHANGEYSVLAHLKNGSLRVSNGDHVERGERIARCGHSGNSTEPHLHFQIQDHASFFRAIGLPVYFANLGVRESDSEMMAHKYAYVREGQQVEPM